MTPERWLKVGDLFDAALAHAPAQRAASARETSGCKDISDPGPWRGF
jgi:hypothetical protein